MVKVNVKLRQGKPRVLKLTTELESAYELMSCLSKFKSLMSFKETDGNF